MEFTDETVLFQNSSTTEDFIASQETAQWLNDIRADFRTSSLITTIYLGTIIFFIIVFLIYSISKR
jgi:hypothetical protein